MNEVVPHPESEEAARRIEKIAKEVRPTFSIPNGAVPIRDIEDKMTGGFVMESLADKMPGYAPVRDANGKIISVKITGTLKSQLDKMKSALNLQPGLLDMEVPGYEPLRLVLEEAYNQSARGKGRQRHSQEKPFLKQPIMEIGRMVGVGGATFQIMKKTQEAATLVSRSQFGAAKAELLGAIVYAAAAYLLIEEHE